MIIGGTTCDMLCLLHHVGFRDVTSSSKTVPGYLILDLPNA